MKLKRSSTLPEVAAAVARALAAADINAVLTGGACATFYTDGEYQSSDLDFILLSAATRHDLDAAMGKIDFKRKGNHYEHPEAPFIVEFPPGPLGIGVDIAIRPVDYAIGNVTVKLLSPTDSCRDRLAGFYHWKDRQSLETAVRIAQRHKVNLKTIRTWSSTEGASGYFAEFLEAVRRGKPRRHAARKPSGHRKPAKKK